MSALPGIAETARALRAGEIGSTGLTQLHLDRIARLDGRIDSYLSVFADRALEAADRADRDLAAGLDKGPMHGIPYCLKDIFDARGTPTTCHSRILPEAPAARDAAVVARLEDAGAVLLGKTALHEFGTGGPAFDLPFPPARNPWDRERHPGGSSSGSGAAVAAGLAMAGIGTDTLGSVRSPASACGLVGLKPTYGLVSRAGCFPLSFSLDHVGPLTRDVEDCAIVLDAMAPPEGNAPSYRAELGLGVAGLRIGTLDDFHEAAGEVDGDVAAGFDAALAALRDAGATVVSVRGLPSLGAFRECAHTIHRAEAYAVHRATLAARPEDYCAMSREKLLAGAFLGAADFVAAQQARRHLSMRYRRATRGLDAVIGLSSFTTPCRIDDAQALAATYRRHMRMPFNVTGDPCLAMPVRFTANGLPVAVQLASAPRTERRLLRIAQALESGLGLAGRCPPGFEWDAVPGMAAASPGSAPTPAA